MNSRVRSEQGPDLLAPRSMRQHSCLWTTTALLVLCLGIVGIAVPQEGSQKPKRVEEEEPIKPKRTQPLRVEDDDPLPSKASPPMAAPVAVDLSAEAERTTNRLVRDLFKSLAIPHDRLVFTSPPRIDLVEPLRDVVAHKPGRSSVFVTVRRFNERMEMEGIPLSIGLTKDHGVIYYEQYALERVDEFLKRDLSKEPPTSRNALSRMQMYREAEKALTAVIRFHESARERGVRRGDAWEPLEKRVRLKLRDVQLLRLKLLVDAHDWEAAAALAAQVARNHADDPKVQTEIALLLSRQAEEALRERDFLAARAHVERLEEQFPNNKALEPLLARLQERATQLLLEVDKLLEQGNRQEASRKLEEARRIAPHARELRSDKFRPISDYSTLYVGVRALPRQMTPETASTEEERQALELLYEGLVRYRPHAPGGPRYEPVLAAEMPRLTPLGREFQVHRQAYWSNGARVTAPDVRATVRHLLTRSGPGPAAAWAELLDRRNPVVANDTFEVKLTLGQGYLDPLSLMTFKVLPQGKGTARPDERGGTRPPVGSGPFRFEGWTPDRHAVFAANTYYAARPEKRGLPRLNEIHFVQSDNPAADLAGGKLHLLLDPPQPVVQQLRDMSGFLRIQKMRIRRIWFLAVNHRQSGLNDARLRRALALAIPREEILDECFRAGQADTHRPLNGPYLPDTWAYDPKAGPADPYQPTLAKGLAEAAIRERGGSRKFTLRYPAGDDAVRRACERIRQQVNALDAGLTLELMERSPEELRQDVERDFQYDLAYYSWDYPDHTYWLWPLFASRDGQNLFGYTMDRELEATFRQLLTHREFARIQELTHTVHRRFREEMPFLPLWQLDTYLAAHPNLELPKQLDAQALFSDAEEWRLKR